MTEPERLAPPSPPLSQAEFDSIYARVPRLTVELVIISDGGVVLAQRESGPCMGLWTLPGGTVRYGEGLHEAVSRVTRDELNLCVTIETLLGWIEYPSHLDADIDWPIGMAFACSPAAVQDLTAANARWFSNLPAAMHEEQRNFLLHHGIVTS